MMKQDRLWASNGFAHFRPRPRVFWVSRVSLVIYLLAALGTVDLLWAAAHLIEKVLWTQ